mmetsp:Transcript_255/g.650  ORF Transcript_255/g.650 Transcript_255/m.650 type:complete len:97 (+) Transcript_255:634-924(+)
MITGNAANKTRAVNAGGVDAAVAAMQAHAKCPAVQFRVCAMMNTLVRDDPAIKHQARTAGAWECVEAGRVGYVPRAQTRRKRGACVIATTVCDAQR